MISTMIPIRIEPEENRVDDVSNGSDVDGFMNYHVDIDSDS